MMMDAFERWLDSYGTAWIEGDPDAVVALFAEGCRYYEKPFDEPMVGCAAVHDYWTEGAKNTQENVTFRAQPIALEGGVGLARWQATYTWLPRRSFVELDGVLAATFDAEGRCTEFREWWHRRETEPPA